jgi:hypothetical protein
MEVDTYCNDAVSHRNLKGIETTIVRALIARRQQKQGYPSDDPDRDGLGRATNDSLMTLVNDEVSGSLSSGWNWSDSWREEASCEGQVGEMNESDLTRNAPST